MLSTRTSLASRARLRLRGLVRVASYLSVVALVLLGWSVRRVHAEVELLLGRVGDALMHELGADVMGSSQRMAINGHVLGLSSKQAKLSVTEVLDRFAAHCSLSPLHAGAPADWTERAAQGPNAQGRAATGRLEKLDEYVKELVRFNVLRSSHDEREGFLVCFAPEQGATELDSLLVRLDALAQTGDLGKLGNLRYVTARKLDNGNTHVITVWSDGALRLDALFPAHGDAPGSDSENVPRPPEGTRTLCALPERRDFGLRLYDAGRPAGEVLAFYDRELHQRGWEPVARLPGAGKLRDGSVARAFTREGRALAIAVKPRAEGARSDVSLIDLGSVAHATGVSQVRWLP